MGKTSKRGRATTKPKHSAAGKGGSRRSATGSIASSDMMSQSQATSVDGFANKATRGATSTKTPKPTHKAPPMNVMVPSPMPAKEPEANVDTLKPPPQTHDDIVPTPSSTAESTPETSPSKATAESVPALVADDDDTKNEAATAAETMSSTTPTAAAATTTNAPSLSVDTKASPRNSSSSNESPLAVAAATKTDSPNSQQHPITPDEVMRSTMSLRDQFEATPDDNDDGPAVLDVSVDEIALAATPVAAGSTKNKAATTTTSDKLNLNTPSVQEANDAGPQGGDCCIIQ